MELGTMAEASACIGDVRGLLGVGDISFELEFGGVGVEYVG